MPDRKDFRETARPACYIDVYGPERLDIGQKRSNVVPRGVKIKASPHKAVAAPAVDFVQAGRADKLLGETCSPLLEQCLASYCDFIIC